ncbi:Uncharacterized protein DBV15_09261 [Temnothorax longispinosus]|uniref:Uncharacterized protein n=1 Tax=Temnothorax longispinosus TaxID=300112 RepID=A0A4S2KRP3_9HYME|nr:Uncharacterized protein DBV15_09261 [Temnothorax longispinosus]
MTDTPECKGLTLPLACSFARIHATLRLTSLLTGPRETTNFKTGVSERHNKRRSRKFRPEARQRPAQDNRFFQRVMQLSLDYAPLCGDATGKGRTGAAAAAGGPYTQNNITALSRACALSRRGLAPAADKNDQAPRCGNTCDTPMATQVQSGPEPRADRRTTAAKIVRHPKRFSDLGRAGTRIAAPSCSI